MLINTVNALIGYGWFIWKTHSKYTTLARGLPLLQTSSNCETFLFNFYLQQALDISWSILSQYARKSGETFNIPKEDDRQNEILNFNQMFYEQNTHDLISPSESPQRHLTSPTFQPSASSNPYTILEWHTPKSHGINNDTLDNPEGFQTSKHAKQFRVLNLSSTHWPVSLTGNKVKFDF